ncbi:DUF1330 domain-containing protein [Microlunatus soli]|uniref:Uncharacterized conserved protein, DUF1330 family n=1 Tax=Microlunatus soli TaxID=630515 RepID=A0A1H1R9S3_9ACTN|nr:DUF1330 domain-containing protein [Microlunatus soli]SDS32430.1 Uncharacterized conserved protein, DUF1330 family [Microlunatus soli]
MTQPDPAPVGTGVPTGGRGYAIGYLEDVDDSPEIIEYIARIESTFEPYGGEWLVHGSTPDVVEGELPGAVVIIGFPSVAAARAWYGSPAYQEILALRSDHSRSVIALLSGVPDGYRAADTIAKLQAGH